VNKESPRPYQHPNFGFGRGGKAICTTLHGESSLKKHFAKKSSLKKKKKKHFEQSWIYPRNCHRKQPLRSINTILPVLSLENDMFVITLL
jgi:hypothetical protein